LTNFLIIDHDTILFGISPSVLNTVHQEIQVVSHLRLVLYRTCFLQNHHSVLYRT